MAVPTARLPTAFFTIVISMFVLSTIRITKANESCAFGESVNLTNAEKQDLGLMSNEGLFFPWNSTRSRDGFIFMGCICDVKPCIAVCSPSHGSTSAAENFVDYSAIPGVYSGNLTLVEGEGSGKLFHILVWPLPCDRKASYQLNPEDHKEEDEFYLLDDGSIYMPGSVPPFSPFRESKSYCLDRLKNYPIYHPVVCSPDATILQENGPATALMKVKYYGGLVATPFLIAVVIVYSVLPELNNDFGKMLRCYLASVIIYYATTAAARLGTQDFNAGAFCLLLGFTMYFSNLATYFWLNAMCFDMWRTFGGSGSFSNNIVSRNHGKFVGYSIYVFVTTSLCTAICLFMEFFRNIPKSIICPDFRLNGCWFSTKTAEALYMWVPIVPTIVCNLLMLISTLFQLSKQKRNMTRHLNSGESNRHNDNNEWISLSVKFFIIMGGTRPMAIIAFIWPDPKYLWFLFDVADSTQGIMIFVIFVCKREIWSSIKNLCLCLLARLPTMK